MDGSVMEEILPNEAVLKVFKYLDAESLTSAVKVCQRWNQIATAEVLWKKLCYRTDRIVGKQTERWCLEFTATRSWRQCYYWITKEDRKAFKDSQELCDVAGQNESEPLRRQYLYCRGLDTFPDEPLILQQYGDFLVDRPDINGTWNTAQNYYTTALALAEKDASKHRRSLLFTLYRYALFLANNRCDYNEADRLFRQLLRKLPGSPWVFERYAEFLAEYRHKYALAEKMYRMILNMQPTGSSLISYALFLWQVRRNYALAGKCFRVACELDPNKVYVYINYLGRQVKDEKLGKDILLQSKLYKQVQTSEEDEQKVFSLALAFHQIHCVDEAELFYNKHLQMTNKVNICTLSNLAELLMHSRLNFEEAERLYRKGLALAGGYNDTIEVALGSLMLAQNKIAEGLDYMYKLVEQSHIKTSRNAFTESWMLIYIHCKPQQKLQALTMVKKCLVTNLVRPKLILMFDANLAWAKQHNEAQYEWTKRLIDVYNCEHEVEILNDWKDWSSITVDPPNIDEDDDDLTAILQTIEGEDDRDAAQNQEDEQEEQTTPVSTQPTQMDTQ